MPFLCPHAGIYLRWGAITRRMTETERNGTELCCSTGMRPNHILGRIGMRPNLVWAPEGDRITLRQQSERDPITFLPQSKRDRIILSNRKETESHFEKYIPSSFLLLGAIS
jgi:hypothetical protein